MKNFSIYILTSTFILASCGGGGGGGGGGAPAATPRPSVSISASDTEISINDSITINWSSSLATSCSASGAWAGTKATSGSESFTISAAGANTFTLQCTDTSGSSGSSSVNVNSGYPISIGELHDSDPISNVSLFIDFNNNLIKDGNEPTFNTASDGSFEYRSASESEANCHKKYPTVSNDGTLYTPNINQLGNSNISPFSTIFNDIQRAGLRYFMKIDSTSDCNARNSYWNEKVNMSQYYVSKRMEIYDSYSSSEFNDIGITLSERIPDIKEFQQSAKSIADSLEAEFQAAIDSSGLTQVASVRASSELDTSNLRTFLSSSYPNPSTDLTPVANGIDAVGAQAGFFVELSYPDYMGEWDNYSLLITDNVKISNNGEMLTAQPGCFINFSSLCIQDVSVNNLIRYGNFTLTDYYHKETARGEEVIQNYQIITDRDTLACREYDDQVIRNDYENKYVQIGFSEYRGESYFYPDDLDCSTFDTNGRGFTYIEYFNDGSSSYMELWDGQQVFFSNPEIFFDDYDQDNILPSDFPASTLEVIANLEAYYTNSLGLDNLDPSPNPFNIFTAVLNQYIPILGAPGMSIYIETININGKSSDFYFDLNNAFFYCDSPDIDVNGYLNTSATITFKADGGSQNVTPNEGLARCVSEVNRKKVFDADPIILNKSPITGVINE
jgi:hypothetical protein